MPDPVPVHVNLAKAICSQIDQVYEEYIGKGSFKEVFRISSGSEKHALKIITEPSHRTPREIDAVQKCNHPNIAKLYQHGKISFENKHYDFVVEEYLGGGTLTSLLHASGPISSPVVFDLGAKLIGALIHLNEKGLVHRDIKPDNIMFRNTPATPVLVDFGIVRDLSKTSLTGTFLGRGPGTPYFASPEQLNNEKHLINWRADQFSLGVVLFCSRFDFHPYQNDSEPPFSSDTVQRVAHRGSRNIRILDLAASSNLGCLDKMTRKWPVERFINPQDLYASWMNQGER